MVTFEKTIRDIYGRIQDDSSRDIFSNRLLYSLTGDSRFMLSVIEKTPEGGEFIARLRDGRKKLIFGAGNWGREILATYTDVRFECFVDNNAKGSLCGGLPVISFDEYAERFRDETVIIASRLYHGELYAQLRARGISDGNIINAGKVIDDMSRRQYFDLPELKENRRDAEIFVDGGSFDGATSCCFLDWCGPKAGTVWAFEPDPKNAGLCETNLGNRFGKMNGRGGVFRGALRAVEQKRCSPFPVRRERVLKRLGGRRHQRVR